MLNPVFSLWGPVNSRAAVFGCRLPNQAIQWRPDDAVTFGAGHDGVERVGVCQVGVCQVGAAQVGVCSGRLRSGRRAQVGVCSGGVCSGRRRSGRRRSGWRCSGRRRSGRRAQVGAAHIGARKVVPFKVGAGQVEAAQVNTTQIVRLYANRSVPKTKRTSRRAFRGAASSALIASTVAATAATTATAASTSAVTSVPPEHAVVNKARASTPAKHKRNPDRSRQRLFTTQFKHRGPQTAPRTKRVERWVRGPVRGAPGLVSICPWVSACWWSLRPGCRYGAGLVLD